MQMAGHFFLSAKARTLSLKAIYKASEEKAYKTFCEMHWPDTNGEAVCIKCGCKKTMTILSAVVQTRKYRQNRSFVDGPDSKQDTVRILAKG